MLDLAPDRTGVIPPLHAQRYKELGDFIRSCYGTSLVPDEHAMSDNSLVHLLMFETPATIDRSVIQEDQTNGQVIRAYTVDVMLANATTNDVWVTVAEGTSIGNKKIDLWKSGPLLVNVVRLNITKVVDTPSIKKFSVHLCNAI
jgi:alpha-L-fucosidase